MSFRLTTSLNSLNYNTSLPSQNSTTLLQITERMPKKPAPNLSKNPPTTCIIIPFHFDNRLQHPSSPKPGPFADPNGPIRTGYHGERKKNKKLKTASPLALTAHGPGKGQAKGYPWPTRRGCWPLTIFLGKHTRTSGLGG